MKILCDQCGEPILQQGNFCSYCGSEAPGKTMIFDDHEVQIENPVFCPDCKSDLPGDALFCHSCGDSVFSLPNKECLFCPLCKEKNSINTRICCQCKLSFSDWFSMKGVVAEKLGYQGDLVLLETMTQTTYRFFQKKEISIGRSNDNDVVIPCQWVSSRHCIIDLRRFLLIDLDSSNNTYINRSSEPVQRVNLQQIKEFNIAGSFTFNVMQSKNIFVFQLSAVVDEQQLINHSNPKAIDELRKIYFIIPIGDGDVVIRKMDGMIESKRSIQQEYYQIKIERGYYYFSDFSKNIQNLLVLKRQTNLPINWKILP